jgi:hypothetical protein
MTDDIIDQLSYYVTNEMRMPAGLTITVINHIEAQQAKIGRLRKALALAVGELSTHGQYTIYSPDQLMQQFIQEASRD